MGTIGGPRRVEHRSVDVGIRQAVQDWLSKNPSMAATYPQEILYSHSLPNIGQRVTNDVVPASRSYDFDEPWSSDSDGEDLSAIFAQNDEMHADLSSVSSSFRTLSRSDTTVIQMHRGVAPD